MTDTERIIVVLYAWQEADPTVCVDFEEIGMGRLSGKGLQLARDLVEHDAEARALFTRVQRTEAASRS